jgi:hypothetical protein
MKIRLIAALALAVGAVSLTAQEPNPYAKAKVGDYATYKTSTKLAGIPVDGVLTQQVTAINEKEATITVTGKVANQDINQAIEFKVDLTKPFDPTKASGPLPPGSEMVVEKVPAKDKDGKEKDRIEKVKVGDKQYDAKVETYKAKVKSGGLEFDCQIKAWLVKDLPAPMAKFELAADVDMQRLEVSMDLTETGNRPVEKKEPDKKEGKDGKDGKKE